MVRRKDAERNRVQIPASLSHQRPVRDDGYRFKAIRCGRRWGKSRFMFQAAVTGHGPKEHGLRKWKGMARGGRGVWLGPDYPQTKAIWEEEILPRFEGARGVRIKKSPPFEVELPNQGHLEVRSARQLWLLVQGHHQRPQDGAVLLQQLLLSVDHRRTLRTTHSSPANTSSSPISEPVSTMSSWSSM